MSDRNRYLGEALTLTGVYTTDFRHYALFTPEGCEASNNSLVVGRFLDAENKSRRNRWWDEHCGDNIASCEMKRTLTLIGRLERREDGIYLDVLEVLVEAPAVQK